MARPLRIEYAGALYHITSRGDRHEDIYRDNEDRKQWLEILSQVCDRFNWVVSTWLLPSRAVKKHEEALMLEC